jgi:hypothetical protein
VLPGELACGADVALAECFLLIRWFPPEPALPSPSLAPAWAGSFFTRPMSRVSWHLLQDRQTRAHLIVAVIALADGAAGDELTAAQSVLLRLVRKQKPASDYASRVVRDAGRPEIYLAFEDEGAAREFAAVVKAKATSSYPGWASQRAFRLDGAKVTAMAASLPAPKTRPRHLPEDGSSHQRSPRRGARTPFTRPE